ncbi:MAG: hypothetical protein U0T73_02480 [Chitinophagales bacterium]
MEILQTAAEPTNGNQKKITVGFKCLPELKMKLLGEAQKLGVTLSEHVETIVSSFTQNEKDVSSSAKPTLEPSNPSAEKLNPELFLSQLNNVLGEQLSPLFDAVLEVREAISEQRTKFAREDYELRIESLCEENAALKELQEDILTNADLQAMFERYKGKKIEYLSKTGEKGKKEIKTLGELINVLVETSIDKN